MTPSRFPSRCSRHLQLFITGLLILASSTLAAEPLQVLGWIEPVTLSRENLKFMAKVDTGADHSSIHAEQVKISEQDGQAWVEFVLIDEQGQARPFRKKLKRQVRIKKKISGHIRRPVIEMPICIGDRIHRVSMNLSQRQSFRYPLLLGRSALRGHYLVDPAQKHLQTPSCDLSALENRQ